MSDPVDLIREIIHEGGPDTLTKIANALGYDEAWMLKCKQDAADSERFRALMRTCTEFRTKFNRDNSVREIRMHCKVSVCTAWQTRARMAEMIDSLAQGSSKAWPGDPGAN